MQEGSGSESENSIRSIIYEGWSERAQVGGEGVRELRLEGREWESAWLCQEQKHMHTCITSSSCQITVNHFHAVSCTGMHPSWLLGGHCLVLYSEHSRTAAWPFPQHYSRFITSCGLSSLSLFWLMHFHCYSCQPSQLGFQDYPGIIIILNALRWFRETRQNHLKILAIFCQGLVCTSPTMGSMRQIIVAV